MKNIILYLMVSNLYGKLLYFSLSVKSDNYNL